ncbi:ZN292 protein, partial [Atractosteus spatula]|nr:ZN292 protein [Atractosteus spatula]
KASVQHVTLCAVSSPQTLVEYAGRWKISEDPLPLVEVYMVAILSYAQARHYLTSECENVSLVLERLTLSCVELLLSLPEEIPNALWQEFQLSVQKAHSLLLDSGNCELHMLSSIAKERGVWANDTLQSILSKETPEVEKVREFLEQEGAVLLDMRVKHLIKENHIEKAALVAKVCSEHPEFGAKSSFKQTYLVCLCSVAPREQVMQEISEVDCKDALEMICNLESEGDEKGALSLCSAFLTRQLLQGDMYCAWELTLFWSKLLQRLEPSTQVFLDHCRQMSLLSKTVYHIFFLIKVIQSEVQDVGLPVCIELCVRALRLETGDNTNIKATICKTISCLLPNDLEVKRACQLTEFLLEPTVDSYYAVETLYNEPDQKFEEENLPVPNSLRCELLLVFKTQWPFDPEFWDWKTLKRHCLALMGEEASIVSSIDELNDCEVLDQLEDEDGSKGHEEFKDLTDCFLDTTHVLNEIVDEKQKKREIKKLREKGFISARFRNWQAYMQYCVLCDKEFLGHRIVRHAQKHVKDGVYSCPICAESFDCKELFVPHVTSHVKQSCKERLAAMKTSRKLGSPTKMPFPNCVPQKVKTNEMQDSKPKKKSRPCSNDAEVSKNSYKYTEEYTCPVTNCRKGFKYFKNLIAHVKAHKNNEEAKRFLEMQSKKVVCQYCRRQFVSVTHLNDHLQMHCGAKPYICIQLNCKSSFLSNAELLVHRKEHTAFKAKCMFPNCGRIFYEAYMLYDHEAQHYNTFTCKLPNCGKIFHSQAQLDVHQEDHNASVESSSFKLPDETLQPGIRQIKIENTIQNIQDFSQALMSDSSQTLSKEANEANTEHLNDSLPNQTPNWFNLNQSPDATQTPLLHPNIYPLELSLLEAKTKEEPVCSSSCTENSTPYFQQALPINEACDNGRIAVNSDHKELEPLEQPELLLKSGSNEIDESTQDTLSSSLQQIPNNVSTVKTEKGPVKVVQRFNCTFETCTRNYSSTRSVSKHMKAAHPEYYAELKLARKNKKVVRTPIKNVSTSCSINPTLISQPSSAVVPQLHNRGGQVLDSPPDGNVEPTVMPQLSATPTSCESSHLHYSSNLINDINSNESPQVGNMAKIAVPQVNSSNPNLPSNVEELTKPLLPSAMENISHSLLPSYLESLKVPSVLSGQLEPPARANVIQHRLPSVAKSEDETLKVKRTKHNKRAKWPAIVKDGKFICSRCFREFPSPKSLGGHLSKRSHCVPFEETANGAACDSNEVQQNNEILKQSIETATIPNLFEPSGISQQTFQNPCGNEDPQVNTGSLQQNILPNDGLLAAMASLTQNLLSNPLLQVAPAIPQQPLKVQQDQPNDATQKKRNVKKKLRAQILAADLLKSGKTGNLLETLDPVANSSLQQNSELQNYPGVQPSVERTQSSELSEVIQTASTIAVNDVSVALMSNSLPGVESPPVPGVSLPREVSTNNQDPGCGIEKDDEKIMEIQRAFERLNLNKESNEDSHAANAVTLNNHVDAPKPVIVTKEVQSVETLIKPFVCESEGCSYSAMTKDALFKHYSKVHNYTEDMMNEIRKNQLKFAPFRCQICNKTFTRNSNLRAHCQTVHCLSQEDMIRMKIKRPYSRKSEKPPPGFQAIRELSEDNQLSHPTCSQADSRTGFLAAGQAALGLFSAAGCVPDTLKKPKVSKPKVEKPQTEKLRKTKPKERKEKKAVAKDDETVCSYSPYRPYRCVHQGCFAAFTIQQNLILHYRAVHQDEVEEEEHQIKEFRCQVKDCSRIFPEVTSLLQHYLHLHKFSLDEAGALMSNMNLGRFQCDQANCTASFTAFWKYISHIQGDHENKVLKSEGAEGLFKCDCEGCDRVYATRSNLLRHLLKKHREYHRAHLIRPRKKYSQETGSKIKHFNKKSKSAGVKLNGKENVQNNKKPKFKRNDKRKRSSSKRAFWTKFERPTLKTNEEALAMCTKKFPLQFPCMIKGCFSVVSSERNIFRHYTTHSLTDRYIEERRGDFILCKKRSHHSSKAISCKDEADENTELSDAKQSTDESSGVKPTRKRKARRKWALTVSNVLVKSKRGRPLKKRPKECTQNKEKKNEEGLKPNTFKPMGFEVSFLKFLEESSQNIICKTSETHIRTRDCQNLIDFRNPLNLTSVKNVKIVVDKTFSDGADLLLKQLQEMRPIVILKKWLYS